MDCRHFRKQHSYFVDDMLSGVATWEMRNHLAACHACARFDSQLRRALHVARRAPMLEPTRDFRRKLSARLAAERLARPIARPELHIEEPVRPPRALTRALVASVAAVALAVTGLYVSGGEQPVLHDPIVVLPPSIPAEPAAAPAIFATMSSGLPIYPAMLMAQRASEEYARANERPAQ